MTAAMTAAPTEIVVFDVGNVLIEWDPRHLYRKLLPDEEAVERFLGEVCTTAWNVEQDRGRRWADAVAERTALFPEHAELIRAYDARWQEMVPGAIEANVAILRRLKATNVPVFAITNFSAEKWAEATERFDFLELFDGVVVSAHEELIKPDPRIYHTLFERHAVTPERAVFIDDSPANIEASRGVGMPAIHYHGAVDVAAELRALGVAV